VSGLAEVLAAHEYVPLDANDWRCACGWSVASSAGTHTPFSGGDYEPDLHRTHLAEQIEAHVAERVQQARHEAWDEGWDAHVPCYRSGTRNPYTEASS
jgi:hypothetical protein